MIILESIKAIKINYLYYDYSTEELRSIAVEEEMRMKRIDENSTKILG
jgi:aminoglycoside phosphotransferase family enzyme